MTDDVNASGWRGVTDLHVLHDVHNLVVLARLGHVSASSFLHVLDLAPWRDLETRNVGRDVAAVETLDLWFVASLRRVEYDHA